ncbi:hypothetical protein NP511_02125 [Natrinema thermotolerans]|uniref:Uncharacterized protein n=1 Tax=Natrinema thermotolerans TaxID=121872 RepID=A0AAF0PC61_9EURY|nr:hypothetical protein [Natrinema thermotolerans]WPH65857.1 hypothetical protein HJTV4_gp34 [Haloarchaeal virus HJTV-4]QCC60762.1 hypothetical protein DVR14_19815 [Natrinema thermotolerans]QCC61640.1 hypothetical protein DVR14_23945 [Natrinema thermotolerans]WMT07808.1 hypothetical protein NP511_20840 [Natrinema thermotolerans]WMT08440.1 hypothetical protein NP511_02125 [Natrinema thermotolerans]
MTRQAFDVRWRGVDGTARKITFEPTCGGYLRIEREWTGAKWREVGREPVEDVALEVGSDAVEVA